MWNNINNKYVRNVIQKICINHNQGRIPPTYSFKTALSKSINKNILNLNAVCLNNLIIVLFKSLRSCRRRNK